MKASDWIQIYFGTEKGLCYDVKKNLTMLFLVILNFCRTDIADAKTMFLQPQELAIHLRPGVSQSFPLSISMPSDHPTTDLTLDTSNVPAGLNITFSSITTGNPLLVQVRKKKKILSNTISCRKKMFLLVCPPKSNYSNNSSSGAAGNCGSSTMSQ